MVLVLLETQILPLNKVESATNRGVTWGQRKYAQVMF